MKPWKEEETEGGRKGGKEGGSEESAFSSLILHGGPETGPCRTLCLNVFVALVCIIYQPCLREFFLL